MSAMRMTTAVDQPRRSSASRDRVVMEQTTELIPDSSRLTTGRRRNSADDLSSAAVETGGGDEPAANRTELAIVDARRRLSYLSL